MMEKVKKMANNQTRKMKKKREEKMSTKMEIAIYVNEETGVNEEIYCKSIDKEQYEAKYKYHLFCNQCGMAKVKFTPRKDGFKFFSTWNGEGRLHDEKCAFNVIYKGKHGRSVFEAKFEKEELSTEHVKNTIARRFKEIEELHKTHEKLEGIIGSNKIATSSIIKTATQTRDDETSTLTGSRAYITSIESVRLDSSFIGTRRCVFGEIKNAQFGTKNGVSFAYLNFVFKHISVSALMPESFHQTEDNDVEKLKEFVETVNNQLDEGKRLVFAGIGFIRKKEEGAGLNVVIVNKDWLGINKMSYDEIRLARTVKSFDCKL